VDERFDRILSADMFEHAGHKNHEGYTEMARRCPDDDGLFPFHCISSKV
jgi:cyclopropane-fatty-acyl-phospholipid synthase